MERCRPHTGMVRSCDEAEATRELGSNGRLTRHPQELGLPAGDLPVESRAGAALLDANVVRAGPGDGLHRSNPASLRSFWAISAISSGA